MFADDLAQHLRGRPCPGAGDPSLFPIPRRHPTLKWGYPLLDREPIRAGLLAQARQAVAACPTLALRLQRRQDTAGGAQ